MSSPLVRGVAVLVLFVGLGIQPIRANTVVVPDAFPTVQSAIDSGADTVQIREGSYPERPVVDHAVVLQGIGVGQRPRLAGLDIFNSYFWAIPPLLSVNRIDFAGRIEYTTLYVHPRLLELSFSECSLDAGIELLIEDTNDISLLDIRHSHLGGQSTGVPSVVRMEADTIDGGVSWRTSPGVSIRNCWFRGGSVAIHLFGGPSGAVSYNLIEGYQTALDIEDAENVVAEGNTIRRCSTGISFQGSQAVARGNDIRAEVIGIHSTTVYSTLEGNTVLGARDQGIWVEGGITVTIQRDVVGECGGPGIQSDQAYYELILRNNTVFGNGGSGVALDPRTRVPVRLENNIGFGNGGWGVTVVPAGIVTLGCNDWFGNALGAVDGVAAGSTDLYLDPLFCNVEGGDVTLQSTSPLVGVLGCGQIGALGVGCGVTATLVRRFTGERASDGIRIGWQMGEGATASDVWLERSETMEGQAWTHPLTERSAEGLAVVELDRSAASDRTYWYRLVALEGNHAVVIGPSIVVEGVAPPEFRLLEVGPNPGHGPVRIAFALKHAAAIEIDVFDVQGRRVAPLVSGVWAAGTQVVEWDGRTRSGEVAPTGLYLLRYSYPGGQDRRTIVRMR